MFQETEQAIIMGGVTPDAKRFHSWNWTERMCGRLATIEKFHIHYSPSFRPIVGEAAHKYILLNPIFKTTHPTLYEKVLKFARDNPLLNR